MLKLGNFRACLRATATAMAALAAGLAPPSLAAAQETVLYSFQGATDGSDPKANLVADSAGNLYGTTSVGGIYGHGVVFELAANGTETVLYAFCSRSKCVDGAYPSAGLIRDRKGFLYGTTSGYYNGQNFVGFGNVFEITPMGHEKVLHKFGGVQDGAYPEGGLIRDQSGNLYGTTFDGGVNAYGMVFKLAPDGTETVLHSFLGSGGGDYPNGGLIEDSAGNLFGTTTYGGGSTNCRFGGTPVGCGTIFELAPDGTETVLHRFTGKSDGAFPLASLIEDSAGNLYGTTVDRSGGNKRGTVFKLAPDGTETVLHTFRGGSDGSRPHAGLIEDSAGNLFGTTLYGGGSLNCADGCGTVFEITPDGKETVLYAFDGGSDGAFPNASLLRFGDNFYGTTERGGGSMNCTDGCGTVFKFSSGLERAAALSSK
jgi:uncharacterized repeat protein (TIGR03803 family)